MESSSRVTAQKASVYCRTTRPAPLQVPAALLSLSFPETTANQMSRESLPFVVFNTMRMMLQALGQHNIGMNTKAGAG